MLYIIGLGTIIGITMRILQAGLAPGRAQRIVTLLGVALGLLFTAALVLHMLGMLGKAGLAGM